MKVKCVVYAWLVNRYLQNQNGLFFYYFIKHANIAISAMHVCRHLFSRGHVIFFSLRHSQTSLAYRIMRARIFFFKYLIVALYKRSERGNTEIDIF